MQDIYVDVLIVLNIYVNYFLLRITAALTHSPLKTKRCLAASFYGSLFSLLILVPHINSLVITLIKFAAAVTIVIAAFGRGDRRRFIANTAAFYTSNFLLAGFIYFIYTHLSPEFIHMENSFFYIDFSLVILIVSTAAFYFGVRGVRALFFAGDSEKYSYSVMIKYRDRLVKLCGLADTGNSLRDCFTGAPVIICDTGLFMTAPYDNERLPQGFRLIPFSTISGSSMLPIFRPDEVIITNECSGAKKSVNAMIGLGKSSGKAIFDPAILNL